MGSTQTRKAKTPVPSTRILCRDFINYIEQVRNFAPPTVRSYSYVLNSFLRYLGDINIQNLTIKQIDDYIMEFARSRQLVPASTNTLRCVLRAFFMYVDRYRDIRLKFDYSMIKQVKAPRAPIKFVTPAKAKQIISQLETKQDKLMVMTMFATGMRIGELVKFSAEDFQESEIIVRGKGGKTRVVPIDEQLSEAIRDYIYEHRIMTGPVFKHQTPKPSMVNQQYSASGLRKRWQRQLGPLGLYIKPHAFRHGIATALMQDGMDIRTLQTFLGHSHIATTMLYTRVTDKHLRDSYLEHFSSVGMDAKELMHK